MTLSQVLKKIKNTLRIFRETHTYAKYQSREFHRGRVDTILDMTRCRKRYGTTLLDYATFRFARQREDAVRQTYLTGHRQASLERLFAACIFFDKRDSFRLLQPYYKREILLLDDSDFESCENFFIKHPVFVAKLHNLCGGKGVSKITVSDYASHRELYERLKARGVALLEELIVQHPAIEELAPVSVNTLRLTTLRKPDGSVLFLPAILRMGSGESFVDNVGSGGMYIQVTTEGEEAGSIPFDRAVTDLHCEPGVGSVIYERHPKSGRAFKGFKVPFFCEALDMVREMNARAQFPNILLGWDIAISEKGPLLVEVNGHPGVDMCQNAEYTSQGIVPLIEQIYGLHFNGAELQKERSK